MDNDNHTKTQKEAKILIKCNCSSSQPKESICPINKKAISILKYNKESIFVNDKFLTLIELQNEF